MFRSRVFSGLLLVLCLALAAILLRASLPNDFWSLHHNEEPPRRRSSAPPSLPEEGQLVNLRTWRLATPQERQLAVISVRGQLFAFRADDYVRANAYQGRAQRRRMPSPESLRLMITRKYPEYANSVSATFGKAQADSSGQHVDIAVAVTGQNGVHSRALYMLVREGEKYHIGGVANIVRASTPIRR